MLTPFFYWTGVLVWVLIASTVFGVLCVIFGNIYGGILGSYRLERLSHETGYTDHRLTHWQHFRRGIRAWTGHRYNVTDRTGMYYDVAGMEIPVDGRDPVPPRRVYYGSEDD